MRASVPDVSIVVPAHNEETNIPELVGKIYAHNPGAEIIVVNDYSTDNTAAAVAELQRKYKTLRLIRKIGPKGKATALLQGFAAAKGQVLVMIDADLQYSPSSIPEMIRQIMEDKADIVIGRRIFQEPDLLRRFLSVGYTWIFGRFLLGIKSTDPQSGEKAFKKEILDKVSIKAKKWGFDIEFLFKAKKAGCRIAEIPIEFSERKRGATKINVIYTMIDLAATALRLFFFRA